MPSFRSVIYINYSIIHSSQELVNSNDSFSYQYSVILCILYESSQIIIIIFN